MINLSIDTPAQWATNLPFTDESGPNVPIPCLPSPYAIQRGLHRLESRQSPSESGPHVLLPHSPQYLARPEIR